MTTTPEGLTITGPEDEPRYDEIADDDDLLDGCVADDHKHEEEVVDGGEADVDR